MHYFNSSFLSFFKELAKNNQTEWFDKNRSVYEKEVKKPFNAFVEEMISRIQAHEPEIQIKPSDAIMRINKDIRFSKDKIPYNTHVSANISVYGKKDKSFPGFYFQLSDQGIQIFGGVYAVENEKLRTIRSYISRNLKAFAAAYNDPAFKDQYGHIQGEANKRIPKELESLVQVEPLIANKQFYFSASLPPDTITSDTLADTLMGFYFAGHKVNDFLRKAWKSDTV